MESITNRALAGKLDSAETTGTLIQLMNYSYVNSEDVTSTKGTSKNRYKVNHLTDQDASIDEINAFRQFLSLIISKRTCKRLMRMTSAINAIKSVILCGIAQGTCLSEGMGELTRS